MTLNPIPPFAPGRPVPPDRFIGRRRERERLARYIAEHGDSTAVIGEPRVGKTSLLAYLDSPQGREDAQRRTTRRLLFTHADGQLVAGGFDRARFWTYVFRPLIEARFFDAAPAPLGDAYRACRDAAYETTAFELLLRRLGEADHRLVVLVDELDYLAEQCMKGSPEFLASLRSLLKTGDMVMIAASRKPLYQLNALTEKASGTGSPCFNALREVFLGALEPAEVATILAPAGDRFSPEDTALVQEASGGYPHLVQAAADALWEAYGEGADGPQARQEASRSVVRAAEQMMGEAWRQWSPELRHTLAAVAATHLEALGEPAGWASPDGSAAAALGADAAIFQQEASALERHGFVAPGGQRVRGAAVLAWLATLLRARSQSVERWDAWIREEGFGALLSRDRLHVWSAAVRSRAGGVRTDLASLVAVQRGGPPGPHATTAQTRSAAPAPACIFVSHAPEDAPHLEALDAHLAALQLEKLAEITWSGKVAPGQDERAETEASLHRADLFVAIVSANYLASDFCVQIELEIARARHGRGELQILPVRLRSVDLGDLWLASLPALPASHGEVTSCPPDQQDAAWKDVAGGIRQAVRGLAGRRPRG